MNCIIVGDTNEYKDCLIYAVHGGLEKAEEVLDRMINNPNKDDIWALSKHTNIRIKQIDDKDAWWN